MVGLENGYRNIVATLGITADGQIRNLIGVEGETSIRQLIVNWLESVPEISIESIDDHYLLSSGSKVVKMIFASDPDIIFMTKLDDEWKIMSTIEIKSGTDPAGALERLGAIQKSFKEIPTQSKNFVVLGVTTREMFSRLEKMNVEKIFDLFDILYGHKKIEFLNEIFHYTLRFVPKDIRS